MSSELSPQDVVQRYHDATKHHFRRFARSLGYLDWASQPRPFRSFAGAPLFRLFPSSAGYRPEPVDYDILFDRPGPPQPLNVSTVGDLLRHSLGLSAWKQYRESRWALRVNPSSGNLHPTEAYVVAGPLDGLAESAAVYHYAADRHALEQRCRFDGWPAAEGGRPDLLLLALTSIHWREAWKYGERAFRYCQHDLGHAIAAVAVAAAILGWRVRLLSAWSHQAIAALTGIDRDDDFFEAEREEPACLLAVGSDLPLPKPMTTGDALVPVVAGGTWTGRASQLSEDHVQWTFIDEVASATQDGGRAAPTSASVVGRVDDGPDAAHRDARALVLQRRSALSFDGRSSIGRAAFIAMLTRVMPRDAPLWDVLWWTPRIHLAIFVHRVDGVLPGLYFLPRREDPGGEIRSQFGRDFLWEPADDHLPLVCLARGDCRRLAERLSCDQAIAADGFFSLGMLAEFDASLAEHGPSFYRHLFWESGFVGQLLYLEAEAAGARSTGIGCFYDDPVHDTLGLSGHAFQSLYHFSVGTPLEDARLSTEPGYPWEQPAR